ncbi:hypothetical protein Javan549_0001 [Streptococcus phage Javan549]|nr:hypothetical protein Javan549_0001 [Streptococcus phage Javan549]
MYVVKKIDEIPFITSFLTISALSVVTQTYSEALYMAWQSFKTVPW